MRSKQLAEKLVQAESDAELLRIVEHAGEESLASVAFALKDICYRSWNSEPVQARKAHSAVKMILERQPTKDVQAVSQWIEGIAELTKGNLERSVECLRESARIFLELGKRRDAAQSGVAMLIPLGLLGKYEDATRVGENALAVFEESHDSLAAGKIEMNLSNIASRQGEHHKAERYGLSACERFVNAGETEWQTLAENGLANTYSELNDFHKAEEFYEKALVSAREAKMLVTEAEIEASMGNLATFRGRYADALRLLEHSRQKFDSLEMPHQSAVADLEIAEIYQTLNLKAESSEIYERVTDSLRVLKLQGEEARARANFGRLRLMNGEYAEALDELGKSAKLFEQEGNSAGSARVRLIEAYLEFLWGRHDQALTIIDETSEAIERTEDTRLKLEYEYLRGEILRVAGPGKESGASLLKALNGSLEIEYSLLAQMSLNSLGLLALVSGDAAVGEEYFTRAVGLIETMRAPIGAEEFRMAFLSDKLAPYTNLAKIYISEGRSREAFEITEQARSRTLAENVFSVEDQDEAGNADPGLSYELNALREELNWYYSRLNRSSGPESESLQKEAFLRENRIADLSRRIESTRERAESEGHTTAVSMYDLSGLQKLLGSERALVEYVEIDEMFSAFVVTEGSIDLVEGLGSVEEVTAELEGLRFQFGSMRYGASHLAEFSLQLKTRADAHLNKLYESLFRPLEGAIQNRSAVIVPAGVLNYVPFTALFDGEAYQVQKRTIVYAPGARVWAALDQRQATDTGKALLIGYADEKIPLVDKEIESIAAIIPDCEVFTGADATSAAYIEASGRCPLIHLACHGRFRPDNPLFSSLQLADGQVTVRDIQTQKVRNAIVTLSACETGLSKIYAGEEILGLARGFLTAGVSSIVLSLWTVSDDATAALMSGFYTNLRKGDSVTSSLQKAQIKMIEEGMHPYLWAPFVIIGKQ